MCERVQVRLQVYLGKAYYVLSAHPENFTLQLHIILVNQPKNTLVNREVCYYLICKEALYSLITWKKEAQSRMTFGPEIEISISDRVRKKWVSHTNFNPGEKNFFHLISPLGGNRFTLCNIAHTVRPGWILSAVTRWNHTELVLGWNFTRL